VLWAVVVAAVIPVPGHAQASIDWTTAAANERGKNGQVFSYVCPPNGVGTSVWGTDVYTDDSRICMAAVHAGLITYAAGGTVTIRILPGQSSYAGSQRNGVTSASYGAWSGSYAFVGGGGAGGGGAGGGGAGGLSVRTQKQVYAVGEPIVGEFSGFAGRENGWITLAGAADGAGSYGQWFWTNNEPSGTRTFIALTAPGNYELRGYVASAASDANLGARYRFTVGAGGVVTPPPPPPPPPPPGGGRPPYAPTLLSPGNTFEPPLAATGGLTLIWRNNGDPDGDSVGAWVNLFRTQYDFGAQRWGDWEFVHQGWGQGDRLEIGGPHGLMPGACYAWRVFAVDLGYLSNPYYAESGWSVFCTQSEGGGGDIDIYIEP
jgi:hypothetical protein